MKKDYTKIVFVVDRSGSMSSIANDIIGGYNTFIADQKALKHGTCDVSFYQFDTEYDTVYENTPIDFVKELDSKTFVPRGGTALYDAVGRTIENVGKTLASLKEEERPDKILFIILTDGEENSSKLYKSDQVKAMIEHQDTNYKWQFTYIGANQNAWATGQSMGVKYASSLTYNATSGGTKAMFASLNNNTRMYRTNVKATYDYELSDIDAQAAAGTPIDAKSVKDQLLKSKAANKTTNTTKTS